MLKVVMFCIDMVFQSLLLLVASSTMLCKHSTSVSTRAALWLRLNNCVNNWWNFAASNVNEIQLKFPARSYSQTCTITQNVFTLLSLCLHATVIFSKFLKVQISGERQKPVQKAAGWPCGVCGRGVGSNSIQCTSCHKWVHRKCSGIK